LLNIEQLHATHLRSTHSAIVDSYRSAASRLHLPYLSHSGSPDQLEELARDVATRCNADYLHVSPYDNANAAFDLSRKYIIYLEFPSIDDMDSGAFIMMVMVPC
jgi:hypothetical protein